MTEPKRKAEACLKLLQSSDLKSKNHIAGIRRVGDKIHVKMFRNPKAKINPSYPSLVSDVAEELQSLTHEYSLDWIPRTDFNLLKISFSNKSDRGRV